MKCFVTTQDAPWREELPGCETSDNAVALTGEKRQTVDGFGGCFNELGQIALELLSEGDRKAVYDALFLEDGCGFNYCRLPIGANDFSYNWYSYDETDGDYDLNDFSIARDREYVIPYLKEGLRRRDDMILFASPWSPPTWMKFPKVCNYGKLVRTKENLSAYARYFRKYLEAYRAEGVTVQQIMPQNEPFCDQKFPSCVWSGAELTEFIADYLYPEIGDMAEIWWGTMCWSLYHDYLELCMQNEVCRKAVKGAAYQWSGMEAVQKTRDDYPHLRIIQSECMCFDGSNTWEQAITVFDMLRHYFRNGGNAFVYWNMVLQSDNRSTWGWHQNSLVTVDGDQYRLNPEFYVMKHFSHFVKRNAVVLKTAGDWSSNTAAFVNPDGTVVFVLDNPQPFTRRVRVGSRCFALPPKSFSTVVFDSMEEYEG